jgi:alkanesulfonate monooxygenase SsuD/methylene tetrahydromethanopterin reductase-like flavin-dependent oxidoreductase (luciferase family)
MSIDLGVHVGQQNMSMDDMRMLWRKLDGAGVDWISAWDHIYEAPPAGGTIDHFEAVAVLGALAAETNHARLGCLVFYVGYRNPALLAKVASTLDHISGGRFELGLGGGWHGQEAAAYGYDFPSIGVRLDMLEEAIQIARGLLTQDRTTFAGTHFSVTDASNLPAPIQKRMPIWIGGIGKTRTLPMAARHADGWNAAYITPEHFSTLCEVLDETCDRIGRDPAEVQRSVNLSFELAVDEAGAATREAAVRESWGEAAERILGGSLIGTPGSAVERILEYRDAGAGMVNIALRAPWNDESLDAYLTEVMPAVRDAT